MTHRHTISNVTVAYSGWTRLLRVTVMNSTGNTLIREIEDHGAAVCVLPFNSDRRTAVLVRQFRAPVQHVGGAADLLEAIAGLLERETPAECAQREAQEEAGLAIDSLELVHSGWTMPGLSTERMHFFLASYHGALQSSAARGARDQQEETTPLEFSLSALADMADSGQIADVKTLLLIQTLRLRRPALFASDTCGTPDNIP